MTLTTPVITVFGATGFLGRHVVAKLAKTGAIIRTPSRRKERAYFLKTSGTPGQIVPLTCNPRDETSVRAAIRGSDCVINLIGILFENKKNSFTAIHADIAENIAKACRFAGVPRLVHVSAINADMKSSSSYLRSKAEGELRVQKNFPGATILRPSIIFGPGDGFFNLFARFLPFVPFLPLFGGGVTKFQPIWVVDMADAVIASMKPKYAGKTYEIGGPGVYSFRELLEKVLTETGYRRPFISTPWLAAKAQAFFFEMLPNPFITRDQIEMLKYDSIVDPKASGIEWLGIQPAALETILPAYLRVYGSAHQAK